MKKVLFFLFLGVLVLSCLVYVTAPAYGQECQPIYGGGETCVQSNEVTLNVLVQNPDTKEYVNNLGISDPKYGPNQTVNFHVTLKNISNKTLSNIVVKNKFPQFLDYLSGTGNYDKNSKTLTFTISQLNSQESKTYTIQGKVVSADKLPSNQGTVCEIYQASATVDNNISEDNAQFCIAKAGSASPTIPPTTKGGLPVYTPGQSKTTPPTGPEMLGWLALLPSALAGVWLRKKAK